MQPQINLWAGFKHEIMMFIGNKPVSHNPAQSSVFLGQGADYIHYASTALSLPSYTLLHTVAWSRDHSLAPWESKHNMDLGYYAHIREKWHADDCVARRWKYLNKWPCFVSMWYWPTCIWVYNPGGGRGSGWGSYSHAVHMEDLGVEAENKCAERMLLGQESLRCALV
jgi:hypothetical protein